MDKGDSGISESVLTRIQGFAVSQHDAGYEQGYLDAYRRTRRAGLLRGGLLLLIGLLLGAALLYIAGRQGWLESLGVQVDAQTGNGERFSNAATKAQEFTVTVRGVSRENPQEGYQTFGSGFIFDDAGHIVTTHHVVNEYTEFKVIWKGRIYDAWILPSSGEADVAVLRFNADGAKPAPLLDADDRVQVGQEVLAVGAPFGYELSVTHGIVSHPNRRFADAQDVEFIQTDCSLNRGNSGGPLVDVRGRVVGMASRIRTTSGDNSGVGFALPMHQVREIAAQIIEDAKPREFEARLDKAKREGERARKGFLGVKVLTGFGDGSLIVESVTPGGPAERAGFQSGDVILEVHGTAVANRNDLLRELAWHFAGEQVTIRIRRADGRSSSPRELDLTVTLSEVPRDGK